MNRRVSLPGPCPLRGLNRSEVEKKIVESLRGRDFHSRKIKSVPRNGHAGQASFAFFRGHMKLEMKGGRRAPLGSAKEERQGLFHVTQNFHVIFYLSHQLGAGWAFLGLVVPDGESGLFGDLEVVPLEFVHRDFVFFHHHV